MLQNPQLREAIDIQLIQDHTDKIIYLSCKLGISEPLGLIAAVGPILMMLDGQHSLEAIENHFSEQGVEPEIIVRVISLLDEKYYLSSERYDHKKQEVLLEFRGNAVRAAAHAGRIYSSNPSELNNYLKELLEKEPASNSKNQQNKLVALVAPHIDYRRGSKGYAHAYRQLAIHKPDICILIGTSHQAGQSLFQLSNKDFACPNGTLKVEKDFLDSLAKGYGEQRAYRDELLHRQEHSLELQIPFINYYCPQTRIVPILVGSFYPYLRSKDPPYSDPEYKEFVDCLAETIKKFSEQGKYVSIVAGVDMAHVGQHFGDDFILTQEKLSEIELEDKIYLDSIISLSSNKMFQHISKNRDIRRICGFPSMHTILDVLAKQNQSHQVELLNYQQAVDFETQCLVSFAALGIYA